mgnify:CR=1 FL=1|tara:strand:- start:26 stop:448 length:423 start_codon:yes stop_codon:yes gene_type:complete
MSWNLKEQSIGTYVVGSSLGSNTSVNAGSAIPYQIYAGTTSHGITVSSGVFTLPKGEWLVSFTLESQTAGTIHTADIYIDGSIDTKWPKIECFASNTQSDLNTTAATLRSNGSTTIELRANTSASSYGNKSDCVIYGVKI